MDPLQIRRIQRIQVRSKNRDELKSKLLDEEIEREIVNCYINDLHTLLN